MAAEPLRILMTSDVVGGVWDYCLGLVAGLAETNVDAEVHLATLGGDLTPEQRVEAEQFPNLVLHEGGYRVEWMENPWSDVAQTGQWLLLLEYNIEPHIVHLNNLVHAHLPWQAPVVNVVHSCVLSWWEEVKREQAPPEWELYRQAVTKSLRSAGAVVAPSNFMMQKAKGHYGPFRREKTIHNGLPQHGFVPGTAKPYYFAMGRMWDEAKNLKAIAAIAKNLPWPIYIAGETKPPDKDKAADYQNVHLLGKLPKQEVKKWLSEASVFVSPAVYEPFGLGILEAGLSGCALALGNIPSLAEIWGDAAWYTDPHDAKALEALLVMLATDEKARTVAANNARKQALKYPAKKMAENYLVLYRSLVAQSNSSTSVTTENALK